MIVVFGSINVDLVARVQHIAAPGETVLSSHYTLSFGGKGANQAAAAAAFDSAATQVMMVGAVGKDAFATQCLDNFAARHIDISHIQRTDHPTGVAFISVDEAGENAITVASGANQYLDASLIPTDVLDKAGIVVLQMETPLTENIAFARMARAKNIPVVFNFAPAKKDISWQDLTQMLSLTDYLIVNEHEATVVANLAGESKSLQHLPQDFSLKLIVTLGSKGVDILSANASPVHFDAHNTIVADTTGAGDFFVGTFAAHLVSKSFDATQEDSRCLQAVQTANQAAARACGWLGAQRPL